MTYEHINSKLNVHVFIPTYYRNFRCAKLMLNRIEDFFLDYRECELSENSFSLSFVTRLTAIENGQFTPNIQFYCL